MPALWAALLALPAGWGLGLGAAWALAGGRNVGQLPAATIAAALVALLAAALLPWAPAATRLRLMQVLAAVGFVVMILF